MSQKVIAVCGYGPGISAAVGARFAREGFAVARISRKGTDGYACDLGDAAACATTIAKIRAELGPVTVVHYNAAPAIAGDLLAASPAELRAVFDVAVGGLVAVVQAAYADLQAQPESAVLVTGGGLAFAEPQLDGAAVALGAMGLALAKAAQHKLAGLLAEKLRKDGIYVGEVVVQAAVKGTANARNATLTADEVAAKFWELYALRTARTATIS